MNANSLNLLRQSEPADFQDTESHTRPMFWITDYPIPEESQLMMLHRIVPADALHAVSHANPDDNGKSFGDAYLQSQAKKIWGETLIYAVALVAAVIGSAIQPWQWF